jgi:hypothetical protein
MFSAISVSFSGKKISSSHILNQFKIYPLNNHKNKRMEQREKIAIKTFNISNLNSKIMSSFVGE